MDYEKLRDLMNECSETRTFVFEGMLCLGYLPEICKKYLKLNPSAKFYVWLIDNNYVIDRDFSSKKLNESD